MLCHAPPRWRFLHKHLCAPGRTSKHPFLPSKYSNSPAHPPPARPCPPLPALPRRATTHTDLELRARGQGIPVRVIHNASIMNAVGACGLQLYRFGEAVSIVFFTGGLWVHG